MRRSNKGRFCSVETCARPSKKLGYCITHYQRMRAHGHPTGGAPERNYLIPWLEQHTNHASDECLIWPFGDKGNGYGAVKFRGKKTSASRAMCLLAHGEPEYPSLQAAHSCGNGRNGCVNPNHLRWATRLENAQDAVADGVTQRGERQWGSKLTEADVHTIRALIRNGLRDFEIAPQFSVTRGAINGIRRGSSWAWLGCTEEELRQEGQLAA